jgi:hypothetical protein
MGMQRSYSLFPRQCDFSAGVGPFGKAESRMLNAEVTRIFRPNHIQAVEEQGRKTLRQDLQDLQDE